MSTSHRILPALAAVALTFGGADSASSESRQERERTQLIERLQTGPIRERLAKAGWDLISDSVIAGERPHSDDELRRIQVRSLFLQASEQFYADRIESAMQTYSNALEADPANPNIQMGLARCELELGDAQGAVELCDDALATSPTLLDALFLKSSALQRLGETSKAIETLELARRHHPQNLPVLLDLGEQYRSQLNIDGMVDVYGDVVSLEPSNLRALYFLSWGYETRGEIDESVKYIDEALRQFPATGQLHERRIDILRRAGRIDALGDALRAAVVEAAPDPANPQAFEIQYRDFLREHRSQGDLLEEIRDFARVYPHEPKVQSMLANLLLARGLDREALEELTELAKLRPDDPEIHYQRGKILSQLGLYDEALEAYSKSSELAPFNDERYLEVGLLFSRKSEWNEAIRQFEKGLRVKPSSIELAIALARALRDSGELERSIATLERSQSHGGEHPLLSFELGRSYRRLGRLERAEENFANAVRLSPTGAKFWLGLFTIQAEAGATDRLEKTYRDILQHFPASDPANQTYLMQLAATATKYNRLDLALAILEASIDDPETPYDFAGDMLMLLSLPLAAEERFDEAEGHLEALLPRFPEAERPIFSGTFHQAIGRNDEAIAAFESVAPQRDERAEALLNLLRLYGLSDRAADAERTYEELLTATAPEGRVQLKLIYANVLMQLGLHDRCIQLLHSSAQETDSKALLTEIYRQLGDIQSAQGLIEESDAAYLKAIKIDADNLLALNNFGYSLAERGENLDEAERMVKRALILSPDAGFILDSLGWIYFKKDDLDKAVEYLEAAVEREANNWELNDHLGDAYRSKGHIDLALKYWRSALRLGPDAGEVEAIESKVEAAEAQVMQMTRGSEMLEASDEDAKVTEISTQPDDETEQRQ